MVFGAAKHSSFPSMIALIAAEIFSARYTLSLEEMLSRLERLASAPTATVRKSKLGRDVHCFRKFKISEVSKLPSDRTRTRKIDLWLSALKKELEEYIKNAKEMPEHVKNMALNWIKELHDWDISRDISWGVPIPGTNQVMYVWLEAPIGYISFTKMLGDVWKKYWLDKDTKIYHFIGKDITVHHAVFWPGMLIAHRDYNLPKAVVSGGYLTLEGRKMSTSKRWVVWVKDFVKNFDADYLRYYLVMSAPLFKDCDFSFDDFKNKINNELINIIGNFTHRVLTFTHRKFKKVPIIEEDRLKDEDKALLKKCEETIEAVDKNIRSFKFRDALVNILHLAIEGNSYFQKMEPWAVKDEKRLEEILYTCCKAVKTIAYLLYPYMPKKSLELLNLMNEELDLELRGNELKKPKIIFKKVEDKKIEEMKKKLYENKKETEGGENMEQIDISYLEKIDLRVGEIVEAEDIPKSKKLLKLIVDLGDEKRQIVSGIKGYYKPEDLVGKKVIVICNLKPAKLCGVLSEGMILAAEDDEGNSLPLIPATRLNNTIRIQFSQKGIFSIKSIFIQDIYKFNQCIHQFLI